MTSIRRGSPDLLRRRSSIGQAPSLAAFFFWTTFLVTAAIAYLWVYNQNDVLAAHIVGQQTRIAELENTNQDLQVAIDQLSQIDRITRIARTDLGMVAPPAESLIVYLPEPPR